MFQRVEAVVAAVLLTGGLVVGGAAAGRAAPSADPEAQYRQCVDSALSVTVRRDDEAAGAGQRLAHVVFENSGTTPCRLTGAPGVSLVGRGDGTQLGAPADRAQPAAPLVVLLQPGDAARAELGYTFVDQGGGPFDTACEPERADGYRVYPPHSTRSVFVAAPQWACTAEVHWGTVSTVDTNPVGTRTAKGCTNTATVPRGAVIGSAATDVDLDGGLDAHFYGVVGGRYVYGIRTAAGGVYTLRDPLRGSLPHSGWTTSLDTSGGTVTVIDDRRTAALYTFRSCAFVPAKHVGGGAYRFAIGGGSKAGTGVACNDRNGGVLLERAELEKRTDGRYNVLWTEIRVSRDGRTAKRLPDTYAVRYQDIRGSNPKVAQARGSFCASAPKVEARQD